MSTPFFDSGPPVRVWRDTDVPGVLAVGTLVRTERLVGVYNCDPTRLDELLDDPTVVVPYEVYGAMLTAHRAGWRLSRDLGEGNDAT